MSEHPFESRSKDSTERDEESTVRYRIDDDQKVVYVLDVDHRSLITALCATPGSLAFVTKAVGGAE